MNFMRYNNVDMILHFGWNRIFIMNTGMIKKRFVWIPNEPLFELCVNSWGRANLMTMGSGYSA